jgi:hypothetical protein
MVTQCIKKIFTTKGAKNTKFHFSNHFFVPFVWFVVNIPDISRI